MKKLFAAVLMMSSLSFAAPAPPPSAKAAPPAGAWANDYDETGGKPAMKEEREKRVRMMLVVGMADAMGLSEGEAIKLADRIKSFDDRRRPLKDTMIDSMKTLKSAADGDAAALPQVDVAMGKVLDARAQLALIDKEMFLVVSKDLAPQKKAQLAVFLARFHQGPKGFGGGKGRHAHKHQAQP